MTIADLSAVKVACVYVCGHPDACVAAQLKTHGLWAATLERPEIAFTDKFVEFCDVFQLQASMTLHLFDSAVKVYRTNCLLNVEDVPSPPSLTSSLQVVMHRYREIRTDLAQRLEAPSVSCPGCHSHALAAMVDAQFAIRNLCRVHGHWADQRNPNDQPSQGPLLGNRRDLDEVEIMEPKSRARPTCSDFSAAADAYKSHGSKHLDATGVMTCVCRHDVCFNMLLLRHGERYAYALYLLLHVCFPAGSTVPCVDFWLYDIACQVQLPFL